MQTLEHVNWLGQQQAPSDQHAVIFHVIQKPNPIINILNMQSSTSCFN